MRTASLILLTMAAGFTSYAATATTHDATYSVGNLDGLSAGAKGSLRAGEERAPSIAARSRSRRRTPKITSTELGPKVIQSTETYKHKFWEVNKMFGNKTERQSLIVNFKDVRGTDQTMTLELSDVDAQVVRVTIENRSGLTARRQQDEGWWGDEYWKTDRNQKTWSMQTASVGSK